jgi:hypothetical protein
MWDQLVPQAPKAFKVYKVYRDTPAVMVTPAQLVVLGPQVHKGMQVVTETLDMWAVKAI